MNFNGPTDDGRRKLGEKSREGLINCTEVEGDRMTCGKSCGRSPR